MKEKNPSLDNKCIIFITEKPILAKELIPIFHSFSYQTLEQY